jgi:hypothetical protein
MSESPDEPRFRPTTAREALLAIRFEHAGLHSDSEPWLALERIDGMARDGLERRGPPDFELTDQLADRLAEAHELLRKIRHGHYEPESLSGELAGVLALPPDLEAMVERRIGHS